MEDAVCNTLTCLLLQHCGSISYHVHHLPRKPHQTGPLPTAGRCGTRLLGQVYMAQNLELVSAETQVHVYVHFQYTYLNIHVAIPCTCTCISMYMYVAFLPCVLYMIVHVYVGHSWHAQLPYMPQIRLDCSIGNRVSLFKMHSETGGVEIT